MMFLSMTEPFKIDWRGSLFIPPVWGFFGEPRLNCSEMTEQEACSYLQYEVLLVNHDWTIKKWLNRKLVHTSCMRFFLVNQDWTVQTEQEACSYLQNQVLMVNHDWTIQHWLNRKLVYTSSTRFFWWTCEASSSPPEEERLYLGRGLAFRSMWMVRGSMMDCAVSSSAVSEQENTSKDWRVHVSSLSWALGRKFSMAVLCW